eukprot:s5237_g1.t1
MKSSKCEDPEDPEQVAADEAAAAEYDNIAAAAVDGDLAAVRGHLRRDRGCLDQLFEGGAALHMAADGDHTAVVAFLLAEGAAVDVQDSWGWTPLHAAAMNDSVESAKLLSAAKASVDIKDNLNGQTPLDYAREKGNTEIVNLMMGKASWLRGHEMKGLAPGTALWCLLMIFATRILGVTWEDQDVRARRLVEINVIEQAINLYKTRIVQQRRIETYQKLEEYGFVQPKIHPCATWKLNFSVYDPATGKLVRLDVEMQDYLDELKEIYNLYSVANLDDEEICPAVNPPGNLMLLAGKAWDHLWCYLLDLIGSDPTERSSLWQSDAIPRRLVFTPNMGDK